MWLLGECCSDETMILWSFKMKTVPHIPNGPSNHCPELHFCPRKFCLHLSSKEVKILCHCPTLLQLPQTKAQTFLAKEHSHKEGATISLAWQHTAQSRSIGIFFAKRVAQVRSMSEHALYRHHILSALNLCARPRKLLKYYLFSMGLWKHLDWRGATCSSIRALEVPFQVKLTKMPLVNLGLIESQSQSKSSQNKTFFMFLH